MGKYIARLGEGALLEFTGEEFKSLEERPVATNGGMVDCKVIKVKYGYNMFFVLFPVNAFEMEGGNDEKRR